MSMGGCDVHYTDHPSPGVRKDLSSKTQDVIGMKDTIVEVH